jgi:hypothetical protein
MKKLIGLWVMGLLVGCTQTTTLQGTWKKEGEEPKKFEKLGVVVLSPKVQNKATIESDLAGALRTKGIKAIATFDIFPFAGSDVIEKFERTEEETRAKIRERVNKFSLDGLLVVSLRNTESETRYRESTTVGVSAPVYGYGPAGYNYSGYGYNYDQFFYHTYTAVYQKGYYETSKTYFIETNLFDVETEEMLWAGQTKTKDPSSLQKESQKFGQLIAEQLIIEEVVQ